MEVVTIFEFLAHCGDVDDFFLWFGKVRSTENTIEGDHGKSFASAACKPRQPPYLHPGSPLLVLLGVLVRWDGFSKKTMEKRSQRRVKWWLLRPCFCDLTPHCFVICDRRDRGVDSVLYAVLHASKHGRRGEMLHFSIPSINQSGSFGSILLALATPSTMVPTMPKAIFTFGYTLWMPLTVPLGFAPVCYLYKSQLYWSKKL